jgi:CBS domain-containing protein
MRVRDVMKCDVFTIDASASCHEAATQMFRRRVRHLPVVDTGGGIIGMVTDRDVRHRLLAPSVFRDGHRLDVEAVLKSTAVEEVMSTPVVTAAPGDDISVAARTMHAEKIAALPVLEDGHVVGIVTETDLLVQIVRAAECCCPDVPAIVVSFP